MKRVLHITNIPTPYRIPQLNEMYRQFAEHGYELRVAFGGAGYSRRKWEIDLDSCEFEYYILEGKIKLSGQESKVIFLYSGLWKVVRAFKPEVITVTGFSIATIKLWLASYIYPLKYVIYSGSIAERGESAIRTYQRRLLASRSVGGVAYGVKAKEYLQTLGMPPDDIHIAINTVDTEFFKEEVDRLNGTERSGNLKRLLVISYLSKRKNIMQLLIVIRKLVEQKKNFVLDIVGDGDERHALEDYVRQEGLREQVLFHGYLQREKLPSFMARSYCLLFQTNFDIWGLVINEAMAAGLPCIVSSNAGGAIDLILEGKNGYVVDFTNVEEAVGKISYLLDNPEEAKLMGKAAQQYVQEHANLSKSARGFVDVVMRIQMPHRDVDIVAIAGNS